jgi:hypothetical protein
MAGNVKEWVWNESSQGKRFILGGAWFEKEHAEYGIAFGRSAGER